MKRTRNNTRAQQKRNDRKTKSKKAEAASLERLRETLESQTGRYAELNGARDFAAYLERKTPREDEEILTEPILAQLIERLLGFPQDGYFPQLGRSGLKPDFTPIDLIAHRFVLDAKSSTQDLTHHERQIRKYVDQRQLDYGVLFNLREIRVYRRGERGHVPELSFRLAPLWHVARGEALPGPELGCFRAFCERFAYREMGPAEMVGLVREAEPWAEREARGESVEVDVDFLVDRLRYLSRVLADDASSQSDALQAQLKLNPGREEALLRELYLLALDLAPGTDPGDLPETVEGYRGASGLAGRVWRQYLLRVSQLALTRIMLYRAWEDVGFVDDCLYDGGFGEVYDRVGHNIRRVLGEAFARGGERYRWLYGADNNYDWYRPREAALIEVLYALAPVPLGKLDADVLGALYESYVDEIDRDRLGQFFTPRAVVRFMLDRAGFTGPEGVFDLAGDERRPRRVLDFATGSGGFLVEAARRVIDEGGVAPADSKGLDEALVAIVTGFSGAEISPFPYYLTEVNLLLQVSRLLGRLRVAGGDPSSFVLGVVHADTLTARQEHGQSLEGLDPEQRADRAELARDERFGLVPLDVEKQRAFQRIREDDRFDLVVGNPPYVAEANNKVLFERLREIPAWKGIYRGKTDYMYYFLYLAAEKVAPGGRLCVIVPAGWMNAGNADWLRDHVAGLLRLDELFLFGSYRLFAPEQGSARDPRYKPPTPTVESAILLATKAPAGKRHRLRVVALEDEAEAAQHLAGDAGARAPDRDALLEEMARRANGRAGRKNGVHVHDVAQADLVATRPWPIKHGARDVAARVVAHLQAALDDPGSPVERLAERWNIWTGIETAADAYTARIQRRLPADVKRQLAEAGATTGDPIMELPPGRELDEPWRNHPDLVARSPEPRAVLCGAVDDADYVSLIRLGRGEEPPEGVLAALEPWRQVLASRAEIVRNPSRRWWETAWPRDAEDLAAPKVMALYRTDRGRFALDEKGDWQPSKKLTAVTATEEGLSVAYLCGLLNSELLDLWYSVRGKIPRDVWRNYEPKPMAEIPYRHAERGAEAVETRRLQELAKALDKEAWGPVAKIADEIGSELGQSTAADTEASLALEALVRAIAANRRRLLPHRRYSSELERVVKDPWSTGPVSIGEAALVEAVPEAEVVSVRVDPELSTTIDTDGGLGKPRLDDGALIFMHARKETARVEGPADRIALLCRIVENRKQLRSDELLALRLPSDLVAFSRTLDDRQAEIDGLLGAGRSLVEIAERLVCRLYRVPRELEDEIVDHAIARAQG